MRLKTILNGIEKHAGFVHTEARWVKAAGKRAIEIGIRPRANGHAICSMCGKRAPGYDLLGERRFEYVPLWGIAVFLVYPMRRVACARCGVRVEKVPWAAGKQRLTSSYLWFLARWARRLSWSEVARIFGTSWTTVFRAVEGAVEWGRQHASFDAIEAIGVDEVQWRRGHKYLTVVYEISVPPPALGRRAPRGGDAARLLRLARRRARGHDPPS